MGLFLLYITQEAININKHQKLQSGRPIITLLEAKCSVVLMYSTSSFVFFTRVLISGEIEHQGLHAYIAGESSSDD